MQSPVVQPDNGTINQSTETTAIVASSWQGPLPPPSAFRDYDAIVPGMAGTLLAEWKAESEHRRGMQARDQEMMKNHLMQDSRINKRAQWIAATFAMTMAAGSIFLIYLGHDSAGATLGVGTLASVVLAFLSNGRNASKSDFTSLSE